MYDYEVVGLRLKQLWVGMRVVTWVGAVCIRSRMVGMVPIFVGVFRGVFDTVFKGHLTVSSSPRDLRVCRLNRAH